MIFKVHMMAYEHGKIREVDVPNEEVKKDIEHNLERVFYYGQNEIQPKKMCSVSVGDVVEMNGKFYFIKMVGFQEIDNPKTFVDIFS